MRNVLIIICLAAVMAGPAPAEEPTCEGHWEGRIIIPGMALDIRVFLERGDDGAWAGTIDIPAQGAAGLPLEVIKVEGNTVVFAIAGVPGRPTFNGTLDGDSITGPFTQGGGTYEFELTRGSGEARRRPQDPEPPFPYRVEEVTFDNADVTLAGTLTIPEGDGPFPAVVLLTGSGPQNRDEEIFDHRPFWVIADHLSRNGIAVLRYDDRGVGGSTGSLTQSTSSDFADDALAAVALLRGRDDIAADRVGLLGHSEGGMIAPIAASRSRDVAFLVLMAAPGVNSKDLMALQTERIIRAGGRPEEVVKEYVEINRQMSAAATSGGEVDEVSAEIRRLVARQNELMPEESRASGDALEQLLESSVKQMFLPWYQYFLRYDPRPILEQVTVPVLALNGGLDLQVSDTQNLPAIAAALAAAGNDDVTTRSFPSLNHLFQHAETGTIEEYGVIEETIAPEVLDIITEWLRARFLGD